jgi:hypothetical protein
VALGISYDSARKTLVVEVHQTGQDYRVPEGDPKYRLKHETSSTVH